MAAGALSAEAPTAVTGGPEDHCVPYSWPRTLLLHLGPGALVTLGYLALLPLARSLELVPAMALTAATLLIGVPLELGLLRRAACAASPARRRSGRFALGGTIAFRRRPPAGELTKVVASCLLLCAGLYLLFEPLTGGLERQVSGWLPGAYPVTRGMLVAALLAGLVVDGLVNPVVTELYFRGHLMPRLPVAAGPAGWLAAPLVSAGLFALQHYGQPQLVPVIFAVQAVLGVAVWWTRCLAVAIVVRCAGNMLGSCLALLAVLAG